MSHTSPLKQLGKEKFPKSGIKFEDSPRESRGRKPRGSESLTVPSYGVLRQAWKQNNTKDLVQQVLDNDGELSAGEYNSLHDQFKKKRNKFIKANKKDKALMIRDLNTKSQTIGEFKKFRQDLASAYNTKVLMNGWEQTPQGQSIMNLLSDEAQLIENKCGGDANCPNKDQLGVVLPNFEEKNKAHQRIQQLFMQQFGEAGSPGSQSIDEKDLTSKWQKENSEMIMLKLIHDNDAREWVSISGLKNKIKLRDEASKKVLEETANNFLNLSTKTNPSDNMKFNYHAASRQIRGNMIDKSNNFESLVYDEMIPGRTFYMDLIEKAMRHSYDDLGIDNLEGVNTKDGIDEEEARLIADAMVKSEQHRGLLKNEMTDYFTNYLQKQWDTGIANRPDPMKKHTYDEDVMMRDVIAKTSEPEQYRPSSL